MLSTDSTLRVLMSEHARKKKFPFCMQNAQHRAGQLNIQNMWHRNRSYFIGRVGRSSLHFSLQVWFSLRSLNILSAFLEFAFGLSQHTCVAKHYFHWWDVHNWIEAFFTSRYMCDNLRHQHSGAFFVGYHQRVCFPYTCIHKIYIFLILLHLYLILCRFHFLKFRLIWYLL